MLCGIKCVHRIIIDASCVFFLLAGEFHCVIKINEFAMKSFDMMLMKWICYHVIFEVSIVRVKCVQMAMQNSCGKFLCAQHAWGTRTWNLIRISFACALECETAFFFCSSSLFAHSLICVSVCCCMDDIHKRDERAVIWKTDVNIN